MLNQLLRSVAQSHANDVALVSSGQSMTYAELLQAIDEHAERLSALGVSESDTVAVILANGPDFVITVFAVARLGAVLVPLNPQYKEWELRTYLGDCRPKVIIATPSLYAICASVMRELDLDSVLIAGSSRLTGCKASSRSPASLHRGTFLFQYTSGSTGMAKRVARTQANIVCEVQNILATTGLSSEDHVLGAAPFFHAYGFGTCAMAALGAGARLVTLDSFNHVRVVDTVRRERITFFPGVPFMFATIADSPSVKKSDLESLRLAISAGAPLSKEAFDRFLERFGIPIRQMYGSTETGAITLNMDASPQSWASVGAPLHGNRIRIAGAEGVSARPGEVGEVLVSSGAITTGYCNLAEVNRATFRDGWFWSGDLGKMDEAGKLHLIGRKRLFINVGGNKVDPTEVEAVLQTHPAVREVVVLAAPGKYGEENVKAAVVLRDDCTKEELKNWCVGKIADFKVPRVVDVRDSIPRSPLGKVLVKYLVDAGEA